MTLLAFAEMGKVGTVLGKQDSMGRQQGKGFIRDLVTTTSIRGY